MIITLKPETTEEQKQTLIRRLQSQGIQIHRFQKEERTTFGLIGTISQEERERLNSLKEAESIEEVREPYKRASRRLHPEDTEIAVGDVKIGNGSFVFMAGPCSVEGREQILEVARQVRAAGAGILRGGAFKPRTSPYDFQGMRAEGIELLLEAKRTLHMPVVTEIMNSSHLPLFEEVDIIQVGARNMQNFELLKALGRTRKPILLKRGLASTLQEFLMSAEYIMAEGNENVILCERGIRTFETSTRNTLDLSAVPLLHEMTHLPVLVDPSHATGNARLVEPMAKAAAAAGADGLMIEVHNNPKEALCDGAQSLTPGQFRGVAQKVHRLLEACAG